MVYLLIGSLHGNQCYHSFSSRFSILFFVVVSDDIWAWESLFGSWHNFHVHSAHGHCSVERGLSSVGSQGVGTNETNVERSCVDLELFQELSIRSCRHAWFPFGHIQHPRYCIHINHIRGFGVSPHLDLVAHWLIRCPRCIQISCRKAALKRCNSRPNTDFNRLGVDFGKGMMEKSFCFMSESYTNRPTVFFFHVKCQGIHHFPFFESMSFTEDVGGRQSLGNSGRSPAAFTLRCSKIYRSRRGGLA